MYSNKMNVKSNEGPTGLHFPLLKCRHTKSNNALSGPSELTFKTPEQMYHGEQSSGQESHPISEDSPESNPEGEKLGAHLHSYFQALNIDPN